MLSGVQEAITRLYPAMMDVDKNLLKIAHCVPGAQLRRIMSSLFHNPSHKDTAENYLDKQ